MSATAPAPDPRPLASTPPAIDVRGVPTVRDPDGLAMSSRNQYLSETERARALSISRALGIAEGEFKTGVRQTNRLIATMLEFARLDHPDTALEWQEVPADEWLKEAAGRTLLRDGQTLRQIAPALPVRMDPNRMALAASNLLVNACRYARREVQIELAIGEREYTLAVEDDGPGIPESDREKAFKAFARNAGLVEYWRAKGWPEFCRPIGVDDFVCE